MSEGSFLGYLRSVLDIALQNGGCQQHKDWVILSALSKVQRSLQSSTLNLMSNENFEFEAEDCALLKDVGRPCMKDLEGLSSILVFLLASESSFVNHSAGKTLMVLLDYLDEMPHLWICTMHILWSSLKTWLSNCEDDYTKQKCMSEDATTQCPSTKQGNLTRHKGWTVVMCVFQVLHGILRKCKQEGASKLRTFVTISGPFITGVLTSFTACFPRMDNNTVKHKHEEEDLVLGTLLRFLCSVNHSMSMHSDAIDTANISAKCLILESVNAFAATFSHHCLNPHNDSCVPHYLRHKFLMLLFRLHEWFIEKPSLAITCSDILKSHLDSLCGSLFQRHTQLTGPSLRSPFAPCLVQRKTAQASSSSTCQPERLAVFLIFKVFASLRKVSSGSSMGSEVLGSNISGAEQQSAAQREQWLFNWLVLQINMIGDVSSLDTVEVADCLASSFLQIFVDEDTLMLEVLLLLLDTFTFQFYPGCSRGAQPTFFLAQIF